MFRKQKVPAEVSGHLKTLRALAAAPLQEEQWLAVSNAEGALVAATGVLTRWAWTDVESASWDGDARALRIVWVDGRPDLVLRPVVDDVYNTMAAIRDRLSASIVHVEFLATAGGEVRALIRRGGDGKLFSQLVARGPVTTADGAAIDALERRARDAVGLPAG